MFPGLTTVFDLDSRVVCVEGYFTGGGAEGLSAAPILPWCSPGHPSCPAGRRIERRVQRKPRGGLALHLARQSQNLIAETAMSQLAENSTDVKRAPQAPVISVVDDEESVREAMRSLLRSAGYRVRAFASAENLFDSGALGETACLILDVRMPGTGGLELQEQLNRGGSRIPIIFITAHADGLTEMRARAAGAVDMLRKPFAASDMLRAVETALE
jgi:CheY-like chemotaxis protein